MYNCINIKFHHEMAKTFNSKVASHSVTSPAKQDFKALTCHRFHGGDSLLGWTHKALHYQLIMNRCQEYQTESFLSIIILQLKVNNKEKVYKSSNSQLRTWIITNKKKKKKIFHGVQLFTRTWAFTVQSTTLLFQLVRAHRHALPLI